MASAITVVRRPEKESVILDGKENIAQNRGVRLAVMKRTDIATSPENVYATSVGKDDCAANAKSIRDAYAVHARNRGNACATKAGADCFVIRI